MQTFIIADTLFYDDNQRKKLGFSSFEEMNAHIIENWNFGIKPDDQVIIMGQVGRGSKNQMKELFNKLNGEITVLSKHLNDIFTKDEWQEIGIAHFWSVAMFNEIDKDHTIIYQIRPIINIKTYEKEYSLVVVDSENPIDGMIDGILFSVDAAKWDYTPIETNELLNIYENMKLFNSMEDGGETRTDIKEFGEPEEAAAP